MNVVWLEVAVYVFAYTCVAVVTWLTRGENQQ